MDNKATFKSRKDKRKEARQEKGQRKLQSWMNNQQYKKMKINSRASVPKAVKNPQKPLTKYAENKKDLNTIDNSESDDSFEKRVVKKSEFKVAMSRDINSSISVSSKNKKGVDRNPKTKFEEYLQLTMQTNNVSAEEDLRFERKLAKKLKVKGSKLRGVDDGMNFLLEGFSSAIDSFEEDHTDELAVKKIAEDKFPIEKKKKRKIMDQAAENERDFDVEDEFFELPSEPSLVLEEESTKTSSRKKRRKRKSSKQGLESEVTDEEAVDVTSETCDTDVDLEEVDVKEAPMERSAAYVAPHLRARSSNESEEHTQCRRRVRGLLNRLSESNVESITAELSLIFRSVARSVSSQFITEEILASCSRGPRGNEQYAAVFAALVAGMACLVGIDFSAKLIASLSRNFEEEYQKKDNISLRNLTLLLSYLCIFDVCSSDLIYDFLITLSKRLLEIDVSTILTILQCCGMKIRGEDPAAMKNFILSVQNRVNEVHASGDGHDNKRMEFMLQTICDIKNNKKRAKEDPTHHTRIKKWLQKLKVVDILIRGLTWSKLLDPNKKGQWWLCGEMAPTIEIAEEVAGTIDKEVLEAQKMLQLAAKQRMNTDARKAIFCIVMSGEDYIDAFEKLLRLDLQGRQDREIVRVLVDCCLQEKVFNKYYTVLASKLCSHDKNHKFTLQYCLWDHFKELETMTTIRSMHLARFFAEMLASFHLSLAALKVVEFTDARQLTPKRIMHFRMLFEAIFEYKDALVWNIFTRAAVTPELEPLRSGLEFFMKEYVLGSNKAVAKKFKVAKKALNNVEGVLM